MMVRMMGPGGSTSPVPGKAATRQVSWILGLDGATLPGPQSLPNPLDPAEPQVFMAAFRRHNHLSPGCFLVTDSPSATPQKD